MLAMVNVFLSQLAIVALETATAAPIFLVTKSFSLHSSIYLVLAIYSLISLTGQWHSSSTRCSIIVGPHG